MTYIYILEREGVPFYVGKTTHLGQRKSQHKRFKGYNIIFTVIDKVEDNNWQYWEYYWISQFKTWGFELENKNNGGGGPTSWTEEQKINSCKPKHTEESKRMIGISNSKPKPKYYGENLSKLMKEGLAEKISKANLGISRNKGRIITWDVGRPKTIILQIKNGVIIEEWIGIKELEKQFGISSIYRAFKTNNEYRGFTWKRK